MKVNVNRKEWGSEKTEQCLPCSQVLRCLVAPVQTSLCRKVAFAGIEDESESGSDSGRNGQESEASLSEVGSHCERGLGSRYEMRKIERRKWPVDVVSGVGEATGCGGSVRFTIITQLPFRKGKPAWKA